MNDREILEKRLDLFMSESWTLWLKELTVMAESLENIRNIDDEKTLFTNKGAVGILNMMINLEDTTKFALEQLDHEV
jgi:hypothetical protein